MDMVDIGATGLEVLQRFLKTVPDFFVSKQLAARLQRLQPQVGQFGVDPFGLDPEYIQRLMGLGVWLYRHYFRVTVKGIENLPDKRCMLVANHSGQLPFDAAMIGMAAFLQKEPPRMVRSMVERFVPSTPFVSMLLARCGQVLGTPDNCRRLLAAEELLLVFPEGIAGLNKTFDKAYQLQRFGSGFMRLAIEMETPIVPTIVIGAEEQAPSLLNLKQLGRLVGLPALPITLAPLFGLLPLPTKYYISFGTPILPTGDANDDSVAIVKQVAALRDRMQKQIHQELAVRTSIFW